MKSLVTKKRGSAVADWYFLRASLPWSIEAEMQIAFFEREKNRASLPISVEA